MYSGNDLKVGKKFLMDGNPFEVVNYSQKVVGRGGSIINVKAKNLLTGSNITKTFSDKDTFEPADISTKSYDYLYNDGENYYFMNQVTYEQVSLEKKALDGAEYFLNDGDKVTLQEFNGEPININLEPSVVLEVVETPPGERGDTATGGKKPATMTTGLVIQVPLFIEIGDKLKIDTRTKEYLGRV
ncbi:MAG: elongation factor P [Candidatus Gracilibacteria bacterium]|nr:elongation factor P [Candidatus Gracilibacteria bacterium]